MERGAGNGAGGLKRVASAPSMYLSTATGESTMTQETRNQVGIGEEWPDRCCARTARRTVRLPLSGPSMTGRLANEKMKLVKLAPDLYDISVFGAEPYANCTRILRTPVLAGEMTINDIMLNDVVWYAHNYVRLHLGCGGERWRPIVSRMARHCPPT